MFDILHFDFMRTALISGVLVSIACGIVGSLVTVNRLSALSGGIAHAAYGGLGLAVYLRWPPLLGAVLFSLASSGVMGYVSRRNKERSDTIIGVVWAAGMAFGILMIDLSKGYYVDMMSYLFGSILAVPWESVVFMAVLDIVIVLTVLALFKEFMGMSYDEEFSDISGVPVEVLYYILLLLIALSVVLMIRVVGLILVIALFTIPASIAEMFTKNLKRIMVIASGLGVVFTLSGLMLSYYLDLTSGATIILVAITAYATAMAWSKYSAYRLRKSIT
jgi:zinc transport system permease protein